MRSYSLWFGRDAKKQQLASLLKEKNSGTETVAEYIHYVLGRDLERFQRFRERRTGFNNMDELIGCLYPGLYVLGSNKFTG